MISSLPLISLFSLTIIIGTILSLSRNNWIIIWIGIELNLISFIPIIILSSSNQEIEGTIKYFIPQALGSRFLLIGGFAIYSEYIKLNFLTISIIFIGLICKAGLAPAHFWFPNVIISINWSICILLRTWQKLSPLILIFYIFNNINNNFVLIIARISSIIGGLGGINQTNLRAILAYSSINHIGWITAASLRRFIISFTYLIIYIITIIPIIIFFNHINLKSSNQSLFSSNFTPYLIFAISLIILSIAGLPPLLGFLPKWIVLYNISTSINLIPIILLITGSLISLYFYLSIIFNFILRYNPKINYKVSKPIISLLSSIIIITLTPLLLIYAILTTLNTN